MTQDPSSWADAAIAELDRRARPDEFGDEAWADAAMAKLDQDAANPPTVGQRIGTAAKGLGVGAMEVTKNVLSDLPRAVALGTAGVVADIAGKERPTEENIRGWDPASAIGRTLESSQQALTPDSMRERSSAEFQGGEMVGGIAPLLATAFLGPAAAAAAAGTQQAGSSGADAMRSGASPGGILGAVGMGGALGVAAGAGGGGALENIATRSGGAFTRALSQATKGAAGGGGAGVAYTVLVNGIHNWASDDDMELLTGAETNGLFGAALGGTIAAAAESALAMRARTGRKMTGSGVWDGAIIPEDAPTWSDADKAEFQASIKAGADAAAEQFQTDPRFAPERQAVAEAQGARLREAHAAVYGEPAPPATEAELAARPRPKVRDIMAAPDPSVGEAIYDPVTGAYVGNAEVQPTVAKPEPDLRKSPTRAKESKPFVPEGPEPGIAYTPDESSAEARQVAPAKVPFRAPTGKPRDYVPEGPEPGIAYQPDESLQGARYQQKGAPIPIAPGITLTAADLQPVTDPRTGRTVVNIGDRMRGTIDDTLQSSMVMQRQAVVDSVAAAGRVLAPTVGVRAGFIPRDAVGFYSPETRTARIATYGDMSTAAHEIGHAIENRILGTTDSPFMEPARRDVAMKELRDLGRVANPKGTPLNGLVSEGWAEFVRMWVMQHEDLMHFAPEMTRWFDQEFLAKQPDFAAKMDVARAKADVWRFQGAEKRTLGSIARPKTLAEKVAQFTIKGAARKLNRQFFSSWEATKRWEEAKAAFGKPTPKEQRLDNLVTAFAGKADQQAEVFAREATTDLWSNKTGESLEQAFSAMRGHEDDFEKYAKSRRTVWLRTEREAFNPTTGEYEPAPHDTGQSIEDAMQVIAKLEAKHPHIRETTERVQGWWERVLDYVVEADPLFAAARAAMRQEGEFYVPQKRQFDEGTAPRRRSGTKGAARAGKMGEKLTEGGSGRPTKRILQQMQTDAAELMRRAHERLILNSLVKNGREAGLGALVEDTTASLHGTGEGYTIGQEVAPPDVPAASLDAFFAPASIDASGRAVFKYVEMLPGADGQPRAQVRAIAVHPEIYDAIVGMNPNDVRLALGYVGTVARGLRQAVVAGSVVVNPRWTFYKNATYDIGTAWLLSRYSHTFRDLVLDWVPNIVRTAAHEFTGGRLNYPWVDAYKRMGANVSAPFQSERRVASRTADIGSTLPKRFVKTMTSPQDIYDVMARLMGISDEAPRVWELKRAAREVGWKPGDTMTPEQYMEMALAVRRVTGNRSEGGTATNALNQYIAFFRSAFVTPRDTVYAATASGNKLRFALKAAAAAGMGLLYWKMYGKNKAIQSQDASERFGFISIPLPTNDEGREDMVKIPLSPEVAFFWKTAEMAADSMDGEDGYSGSELAQAYWDSYSPPFVPTIASEPTLQFANRQSFRTQAPIVPEGQQDLPPMEQVGPQTAKLATVLGRITKLSPRRIEHAVGGIWGAPGEFALDGLGLLPDPKNEKQTPRDVLEGTWLRRGGAVSKRSRWSNQLYTLAGIAEQDYASKLSEWSPEKGMMRAMLKDATQAVSAAYAIADTYAMSAKDRQDLYTLANNLAYETVQNVNAGTLDPVTPYVQNQVLTTRKKMLDLQHQGLPKNWR